MKAVAIWPEERRSDIVEVDEPRILSATSVIFRPIEVGLCGTDKEICSFHAGVPPAGSAFLIPGHETIGEVVEVGPEVSTLKPGDLVVPSVRRPCAFCDPCRGGAQDFCESGRYTERGIKAAHGFLAELVVEEERFLHRAPPELRDVGVLTEPMTILAKALRQYAAVARRLPWNRDAPAAALFAGKRTVVLGAGPVGILACMLLVDRGCQVWVHARNPAAALNATMVEALGAHYVSSQDTALAELSAEIGRPELVLEATGSAAVAFDAASQLAPNAVLVLTGIPAGEETMAVPAGELMRKLVLGNQVLLGTVNAAAADFEAAIRCLGVFLDRCPETVRGIVTARHPFGDFCGRARQKKRIKETIVVAGKS